VNARGSKGQTPLHHAAVAGKEPVVKYLIEHGAEVDARDKYNKTALHTAALKGKSSSISFFVTYLFRNLGNYDIMKCLVKIGKADVNAKNEKDITSLHIAAAKGHTECVRLLLKFSATVNCVNVQVRLKKWKLTRFGSFCFILGSDTASRGIFLWLRGNGQSTHRKRGEDLHQGSAGSHSATQCGIVRAIQHCGSIDRQGR